MSKVDRLAAAMGERSTAPNLTANVQEMMNKWKIGNEGGDIITNHYRKPKVTYWQVRVVYNNKAVIRKGLFKKEELNIPFEFSANYINNTKEEAAAYAKYFIKDLIDSGDLPSYVIKNGQVDDNLIKVMVHKLEPAYMERDVSDK